MKEIIKKSIVWWVTFFFTVLFLTIWYAAVVNIWTNTSELEVNTNSTLSADKWNKLLWNFEFLKSKTENIYSSWGNVGIWTQNPEQPLVIWDNDLGPFNNHYHIVNSSPDKISWLSFWENVDNRWWIAWVPNMDIIDIWGVKWWTAFHSVILNWTNVWIWTYNPTEKLDIYWNISFWAYWDDRKFLLRNIIAANWTTCSIACWTSYCLWAYTDLTKIKQTCSDTLNNKNCICIWK